MIENLPHELDKVTGLPIGLTLANPAPAKRPERVVLDGRYCRLEPLDPKRHGDDLFRASTPPDGRARFLYLPEDPPASRPAFTPWLEKSAASSDPLYFAVIDKATGRVEGRQTYLRIDPPQQSIEIGHIYWGPSMARSRLSTEANFLFAKYAFDMLGYRRFEWKCNALNAPSRTAALRLGFAYEGLFRRAAIVKEGRSRDTTWYAMIGEDWPAIKAAYETWLAPENFDAAGRQRQSLSALTQRFVTP